MELNFWNMEINILCILQCHGAALFLKISFSILNSDIILKKAYILIELLLLEIIWIISFRIRILIVQINAFDFNAELME